MTASVLTRPTPSRLRSRPRRCALSVAVHAPRQMVACGDADGEPTVVAWSRALAHPVAAARAKRPTVLPWDEAASSRCVDAEAIRVLPVPAPPWRVTGYVGRRNVEPPPLREREVSGDLAAALRDVTAAPRWVGAEDRLARVLAVIATPGSTRTQMREAASPAGSLT